MSEIRTEPTRYEFDARDGLLVALTFASGAIDAISYFGLGRIFSAFMTGNLVFLGFSLGGLDGPALIPVVAALTSFAAGSFFGTWITPAKPGDHPLWPRRVSITLGLTAALEAAFLILWLRSGGHPGETTIAILLALSAFAMGMQTAAVRALGVLAVFTTAATFTVLALAGDFAGARNRLEAVRLAAVLLGLVAGAAVGGIMFVHARSVAPALPLAVTILVIVIGTLLRRRAETSTPSRRAADLHTTAARRSQ